MIKANRIEKVNEIKDFYKDKKVLVTGYTGFKGAWMCEMLKSFGADVTGFALTPPTTPSIFDICDVSDGMNSVIGDIRNLELLKKVFAEAEPDVVIHMAAQPIVRESYKDPVGTYETNVMGTVNVLECVRNTTSVRSFINVTTDKVYLNKEWAWGYRENEELNGYDPYSNSKSCSELVTSSYKNSFFSNSNCAISTCRAGNVIGGGDFASDRIIPDCVRACKDKKSIIVRNPYSTRPYQHVLEPVFTYLWLAMEQWKKPQIAGAYNIGPEDSDCITTGELVDMFCEKWTNISGEKVEWINQHDGGPHEANFLKLDCSKIKNVIGWSPRWSLDESMQKLTEWYNSWACGCDMRDITKRQIDDFCS